MTVLLANTGLQNIYVPLPLTAHIVFCVIATIVYILEYYRKKSVHYLFVMLAVDATLLMQAFRSSKMVVILAVLEVLLLGTAAVLAVMHMKKEKAAKAEKARTDTENKQPDTEEKEDKGNEDENSDP